MSIENSTPKQKKVRKSIGSFHAFLGISLMCAIVGAFTVSFFILYWFNEYPGSISLPEFDIALLLIYAAVCGVIVHSVAAYLGSKATAKAMSPAARRLSKLAAFWNSLHVATLLIVPPAFIAISILG